MNKCILILVLLLCICVKAVSTPMIKSKAVILEYELQEGSIVNRMYFITPIDSVTDNPNFPIWPLEISQIFKNDNFPDTIIKGAPSYEAYISDPRYDTLEQLGEFFDELHKVFRDNKKLLFRSVSKWESDSLAPPIVLTVSGCSVIGEFKKTNVKLMSCATGRRPICMTMYVPGSEYYQCEDNFWNSDEADIIKYADYSMVNWRLFDKPDFFSESEIMLWPKLCEMKKL